MLQWRAPRNDVIATPAGEIAREFVAGRRNLFTSFLEVTKFRLVSLVLWSTAVGFFLAGEGPFGLPIFLKTLAGTALSGWGAMALNQYLEREADGKMKRTENRPIPSERLDPLQVLFLGIALASAGFFVLLFGVNFVTAALAALTLVSYLFIYTPLKTRSPLCTLAGALPGAAPPLLGWTAVRGEVNSEALILFAILFAWQLPHVLAIGWVYREDYGRAGFRMLGSREPEAGEVGRRIFRDSLALLPLSLVPTFAGMTGKFYLAGAFLLGVWFLRSGLRASRDLETYAKSFFRHSIIYLTLLFLWMMLDKQPL